MTTEIDLTAPEKYNAGLMTVGDFIAGQEARMLMAAVGVEGLETLTKAAELGRKLQRLAGSSATKRWGRQFEVSAGELLLALVPDSAETELVNDALAANGVSARVVE